MAAPQAAVACQRSPDFCAAAHEAGMTANVFYANTAEDMRLYMDWGIDGILTDNPCLLQEVLAERGHGA